MIFVTKLLENHQPNRPPQSIRSQSVLHEGSDPLEIGEEGTRLRWCLFFLLFAENNLFSEFRLFVFLLFFTTYYKLFTK